MVRPPKWNTCSPPPPVSGDGEGRMTHICHFTDATVLLHKITLNHSSVHMLSRGGGVKYNYHPLSCPSNVSKKIERFIAVFLCLPNEKSPPQAKNLGAPYRRRAKKFSTTFSFSSDHLFILVRDPPPVPPPTPEKFGDNVWLCGKGRW